MNHIAIDLSENESQICMRRGDRTIVEEPRVRTPCLGQYLKALAPGRVILTMCADAFRVAGEASDAGHQVRVLPAAMARVLGVVASTGATSLQNARLLSEASCRIEIPSLSLPRGEPQPGDQQQHLTRG